MKIKNIILLCLFVSVAIFHNKLSYAGYEQGSSRTFSDTTGSATASQLPLISGLLGSATASQLPGSYGSLTVTNFNPTKIYFAGTTTAVSGTQTTPVLYTLKESKVSSNIIHSSLNVLLYVAADAGGSSTTFTDTSSYEATLSATGNAVSSSAYSKYGGASYYTTNGNIVVGTSSRYNIGTETCYISLWIKMDSIGANMSIFEIGTQTDVTFFYYSGAGSNGLTFQIKGGVSFTQGATTGWTAGTEYHVALRKFANGGHQLLRDGVVLASGTSTENWTAAGNPRLGSGPSDTPWKGYIDDFYWEKNTDGTSTVPTAAKTGTSTIYYSGYSTYYIPSNADTPFLTIIDDGTQSVKPQIIIGSTTSSATTTTGIKLEIVGGKVRADQFISPSEEKKKVVYPEGTKTNYLDELKNLRVGEWSWRENDVNRLDAESIAKKDYIQSKKQAWIDANKSNYTSTVLEPGTGTVIKIDKVKMEKDYKTYIEFEWASLPGQTVLINDVENKLEAGENPDIHLTPFAGDPTTPAIFQSNSKQELSLNDQIGWSIKVMKAQQKEIENLKQRLNAASIP